MHAIEEEISEIDTRELANCKHYMAINLDDPRMEKRRGEKKGEGLVGRMKDEGLYPLGSSGEVDGRDDRE